MSKLNVDQKTIYALLEDRKSDFLIPDYQRPYAWKNDECQTLWHDIFSFAFPDDNSDLFNEADEYFLGSIVIFKNVKGQLDVIDGQQRLTTLLLILRAFYDVFANMQDSNSQKIRTMIEKCIWKTDTFGTADTSMLKIDSEVATDIDKYEFLDLLRTGKAEGESQYVKNYRFFKTKISDFQEKFSSYLAYFPARLLHNCILLPIEGESQDSALRIFSTLNNRGLPLSDADIFKAQFYKYYKEQDKKDEFIAKWKELEETTKTVFKSNNPMDELFTRYMHFLRAKEGNKQSTTEGLRKFYERNQYQYFRNSIALDELSALVSFWKDVECQDTDRFSQCVLKKLFILKHSPNAMWHNITSVYFLHNRSDDGFLDDENFSYFLEKITLFILAYSVTNPGVSTLRTPIYDEMISIIHNKPVTFHKYAFDESQARGSFENYTFSNSRGATRAVVTWWAHTFKNQTLLNISEAFQLEHIYPRKRQDMERGLQESRNLDALGNKILLEESINIKASDYRFEDKKKFYSGQMRRGSNKEVSKIEEVATLIQCNQFEEVDIKKRTKLILDTFFDTLRAEGLLKTLISF